MAESRQLTEEEVREWLAFAAVVSGTPEEEEK
jgi:hypothetical protein